MRSDVDSGDCTSGTSDRFIKRSSSSGVSSLNLEKHSASNDHLYVILETSAQQTNIADAMRIF